MPDISFTSRLRNAWDVFRNKDPTPMESSSSWGDPGRKRMYYGVDKTILSSLYMRMAIDTAGLDFRHVRVDENGRFSEEIDSELNRRLTLSANNDQTPQSFIMDVVLSMFNEGCTAIVPVEASANITLTASYDILQLRCGKVVEWFPNYVRIEIYNYLKGSQSQIVLPKRCVAIAQNPLYLVMNERISVLRRLNHKLMLLDQADDRANSGKLDLLIQLPYEVNSDRKKNYAEDRRKSIEDQVANSKYGVAYISGTERVVQLNRPVENNLLEQVKYQSETLYNQLGITQQVFDGTANQEAMLNYYNRSIEPIANEIASSMTRSFLSPTAITQGQRVMYFRDPFKIVPVAQVAEIADKLTRNAILSSNEFRAILGYKPSDDPVADELSNKNLNNAGGNPGIGQNGSVNEQIPM